MTYHKLAAWFTGIRESNLVMHALSEEIARTNSMDYANKTGFAIERAGMRLRLVPTSFL